MLGWRRRCAMSMLTNGRARVSAGGHRSDEIREAHRFGERWDQNNDSVSIRLLFCTAVASFPYAKFPVDDPIRWNSTIWRNTALRSSREASIFVLIRSGAAEKSRRAERTHQIHAPGLGS